MGCHRGHHVGQRPLILILERERFALWLRTVPFPYIDILRPRRKDSRIKKKEQQSFGCCSDADTIMVFKAEIVEDEEKLTKL